MASYRIEWKTAAVRELRQIDRQIVPEITQAINALTDDPFPQGVRKMKGSESTYRLRIRDYRVVYDVFEKRLVIIIVRVRHRKDAYR